MKMNTFLARHFWSHDMDPNTEINFFIYERYHLLDLHAQGDFMFTPLHF